MLKDAATLRMIVERGRLVPATPFDAERLDSYRNGIRLNVRFTEDKDRVLVRKWWAILSLAVKQCQTPWKNKEQASEAIKLALGIVNLSKTVNDTYMQYPKSLTELQDPELQEALDSMIDLLHKLTGVDPETLRKEAANVGVDEHDPETGEIIEHETVDAQSSQAASTDDEQAPSLPSSEPEGESAPSSGSTDQAPRQWNIPENEKLALCEFTRKALDECVSESDAREKDKFLGVMFDDYREKALQSKDGLDALTSIAKTFGPVMRGDRTRELAESYIATEILSCTLDDLRRRK